MLHIHLVYAQNAYNLSSQMLIQSKILKWRLQQHRIQMKQVPFLHVAAADNQ
jgi:hypothetical protein